MKSQDQNERQYTNVMISFQTPNMRSVQNTVADADSQSASAHAAHEICCKSNPPQTKQPILLLGARIPTSIFLLTDDILRGAIRH